MKNRLITLLTTGRTLDWAKDRAGAYTLRHVNKFPKFAPVARGPVPGAAAPVAQPAAVAQPSLFEAPKAPMAAVRVENRTDRSDGTDHPPAAKLGFLGLAKVKAFLAAGFSFFPRTAARLMGRMRPPAADPRPRAQGELALEKVTVLRNDLSDADVVVVAVQRKPEDSRAAQAETGASAVNAWTRVTARWVKLKNPAENGSLTSMASEAQVGRAEDLAQTHS